MLWILVLLLTPLSIVVNGLLLSLFWGWFLVPLGFKQIGIAHALGVAVTVQMLTGAGKIEEPDSKKKVQPGTVLFHMMFRPLVFLMFGFIYHACMM